MKRQRLQRGLATISGRPFAPFISNDEAVVDKGKKAPKLTDLLSGDEELQDQFDALLEKRLMRERRQSPGRRKDDGAPTDEERQELDRLRVAATERETADLESKKKYDQALEQVRSGFTTKETAWKTREQALLVELRKDRVRGQLIAAATRAGAIDPEDVADLLERRVSMDAEFKVSIRDVKDAEREALNKEGDPMSIGDLVEDLLAKKTHLARAVDGEGAGARGGAGASAEASARGGRHAASGELKKLQDEFKAAKEQAEKTPTPAAATKLRQIQRRLDAANKAA